ncbi:MAG: hypothetical protein ABSA32_07585 [Candidatus Acidiferrales bacterium]
MKFLAMKTIALTIACLCVSVFARTAAAQVWRPLGPEGGDVLSLGQDAANPQHVFLGTADGHVFASDDGGEHWELRGRAGSRLDSVVTAILVDPRDARALYASTWTRDPSAGGGVFRSGDGGRTWAAAGLAGKAVRALAMARPAADAAASVTLVAGTLDGVYRTRNGGKNWERISPEGDPELNNFDSVAIDPADADIIYAGTFHLPWKTIDGGLRWTPIHTGMIDDSDVMSLLADRARPGRVYASACSGIYRSDSGGEVWQKVQGIPYAARRTLEILQDPARPEIVFAATTEGLWKTTDAGSSWQRITPADWSVTAMVVAAGAPDRVLIGVDQRGVLASDDGGASFHAANSGFLHKQILAAQADATHSGSFLIALANAPEFLAATTDSGATWKPLGQGPAQAALGRIYASPDGWWATLATGGLERYDQSKSIWVRAGRAWIATEQRPVSREVGSAHAHGTTAAPPGRLAPLDAKIGDMAFAPREWYAATRTGLLASSDHGADWKPVHIGALTKLPVESVSVSRDGRTIWIASLISIANSADGGASWRWIDFPAALGVIQRLQAADGNSGDAGAAAQMALVVQTSKGLFISRDFGKSWDATGHGLPEAPVQDVAIAGSIYLAAMQFGGLYLSRDSGLSWQRLEGSIAEGYFSSVFAGPPSEPASSSAGGNVVFYLASATDGLYAIEIGSGGDAARGSDTRQ